MRQHIYPLSTLRFVAAMWVFLFHLDLWFVLAGQGKQVTSIEPVGQLAHITAGVVWIGQRILQAGPGAMSFFFVLSGFILAVSSVGTNPLSDFRAYAVRRFARIYPIDIVTLLAGWMLLGFADNLGDKPVRSAIFHDIADLTLTNAWFPQMFMDGHMRDGTWSLSVEMFFY